MSEQDALAAAIEFLKQSDPNVHGDTFSYYDDATGSYWEGPVEDLEILGEMLLSGDRDAYSTWCSYTSHTELVGKER